MSYNKKNIFIKIILLKSSGSSIFKKEKKIIKLINLIRFYNINSNIYFLIKQPSGPHFIPSKLS